MDILDIAYALISDNGREILANADKPLAEAARELLLAKLKAAVPKAKARTRRTSLGR